MAVLTHPSVGRSVVGHRGNLVHVLARKTGRIWTPRLTVVLRRIPYLDRVAIDIPGRRTGFEHVISTRGRASLYSLP